MRVISCKLEDEDFAKLEVMLKKNGFKLTDWLRPIILQSIYENNKTPQSTQGKPKSELGLYLSLKDAIRKYEKEAMKKT